MSRNCGPLQLLLCVCTAAAFLTPPPQQLRTVRRANSLVDDLLRAVDGTDGGVTATAEQKAAILKQIEQLEASYDRAPFDDAENLYRDGTVAYVGQASSKAANAAGGRFRRAKSLGILREAEESLLLRRVQRVHTLSY